MQKQVSAVMGALCWLSALLFFSPSFSFSQITSPPLCQQSTVPTVGCGTDCFTQIDVDDIPNLPIGTVSLDFYFVKSNNHNFQCADENAPYYAPDYVKQIIDRANDQFSNPALNMFGSSPKVPDARIRYQLYGNPASPCDAIYFFDTEASIVYANPDALHIVVVDDGSIGISGQTTLPNKITIGNVHRAVFEYLLTDVSIGGAVLNHELGHLQGLCHAYSVSSNTCPDMDPAAECGGPTITTCDGKPCSEKPAPGCGDGPCMECYCESGRGNNFMGSSLSSGMAVSQWAQLYGSLIAGRPSFVTFFDLLCTDIPPHPPLEIPANTVVEWNSFRVLNQHVEVRPGATLIIRCEVQVAKDLSIIVNRGARLFVLGGKITSQSPDCRWNGIIVHGNTTMDQPDNTTARDETQPIPVDGAGVVWLNNAVIANAHTGISTNSTGGLGQSYYGGLVMVNSSCFINNDRGVEFMKYNRNNNSYFSHSYFNSDGNSPFPTNRGVSIWSCWGIDFDDTHFENNLQSGIEGINFTVSLIGCTFKGSEYGFKSESTMPNYMLFPTDIDHCEFSKNRYDIYINSSNNMIYGYKISNNLFYSGKAGSIGIYIRGESDFDIYGNNTFMEKQMGNWLISTGSLSNYIRCNNYISNLLIGIKAGGSNSGLEMLGNTFVSPNCVEMYLDGSPSTGLFTEIHELQGNPSNAAGNCFSYPAGAIRALTGVIPFKYYVHNLENPVVCKKPTGNLSDGGANTYTLHNSIHDYTGCDGGFSPPRANDAELTSARENTMLKRSIWSADTQNEEKRIDYLLAAETQKLYLEQLVGEAFKQNDLDHAEQLLLGENTNVARRGAIGLRVMRGNYSGAQALLNSMPVENQDDQWFKEIMSINQAMMQSTASFVLTMAQETLLHTIANTPQSIMAGYACSLLSLCKGFTCEAVPDENLSENSAERGEADALKPQARQIQVYPNPTPGSLTMQCPDFIGETLTIEILDMSGRSRKMTTFVNTGRYFLDLPDVDNGIYQFRILNNHQMVYTTKVVIIR